MKHCINKPDTSRATGALTLVLTVALAPWGAAQIINEDFESYTAGDRPTTVVSNGAAQTTGLRPNVNDPDNTAVDGDGIILAQVVSGAANTAGGGVGNGLQLIDDEDGAVSSDHTAGYEVDVVPNAASSPVTNLHVSFDVAWTDLSGTTDHAPVDGLNGFKMGFGAFGGSDSLVLNSSTRRFCTVDFENDGEIDGFSGNSQLTDGVPVSVELFANDSDTDTISYTPPGGGTAMLAPNEVALYLGGALEGSSTLMDNSGTPVVLAGDYNLGRFGFASASSFTALSYVIDNLVIEEIVETPVLLIEDFESQTVGDNPEATRSSPGTPEIENEEIPGSSPLDFWNTDIYVLTVDQTPLFANDVWLTNVAGTGKGVAYRDEKIATEQGSGGSAGLDWEFVASEAQQVSSLKFSVDVVWQDVSIISAKDELYFGIGNFGGGNMGSSSNRDLSARIEADGYFSIDDSGTDPGLQLVDSQVYTMTVYLSDLDTESIIYDDPGGITRLLGPNSGAFYIDETLVGTLDYRDQAAGGDPIYAGENNIGRVGFASPTDREAGLFIFDNVFASEIVPSTGTPVLFNENFESYADGATPIADGPDGVTVVTGAANVAGGGTGNGMQLFDDLFDISVDDDSDYQVDLPNSSNYHISLDTAWNNISPGAPNTGTIKIRVGQAGDGMTSGARAYFSVGLNAIGQVSFPDVVGGGAPTSQLTDGAAAHIDIFVNDSDTDAMDYPSPAGGTGSVAANSFAVYVDNAFVFTDVFDDVSSATIPTVLGENLGRFGIVSAGDDIDLDYTFDNIVITEIPEISTVLETPIITSIVATLPDTVVLTFDSVDGNDYQVWFTDDLETTPFTVIDTVSATGISTTYTRSGVALGTDGYFQVENIGPTP